MTKPGTLYVVRTARMAGLLNHDLPEGSWALGIGEQRPGHTFSRIVLLTEYDPVQSGMTIEQLTEYFSELKCCLVPGGAFEA